MSHTGHIIRGTILLVAGCAFLTWFFVHMLRRSEDPAKDIVKFALTVPLLLLAFASVSLFSFFGPFVVVFCAVIFSILWTPSIGAWLVKPLTSLFDDGDRQLEPRPMYSIARARRNRGKYTEAVTEIRRQLEKFPNDFEGQLLLAEIQVENLNDLPGAEVTVQRLIQQKGHPPRSLAYALNSLADWQLKYTQDREAARQSLEKIIELMPESELSALAAQRIAHLADTEHLLAHHDQKRIPVKSGVQNMGLLAAHEQPKAPEVELASQAAEYVRHLEAHPLDTEAREKLAVLYADQYQRLDLATDQLEQLIAHPGQPAKRVVHWLNLLADLQVRHAVEYQTVHHTLERILELFPDSSAAELALTRLNHLKLELKGQTKGSTLKLGTYEQDIGLKRGLPKP